MMQKPVQLAGDLLLTIIILVGSHICIMSLTFCSSQGENLTLLAFLKMVLCSPPVLWSESEREREDGKKRDPGNEIGSYAILSAGFFVCLSFFGSLLSLAQIFYSW